jgi:phosphopantothenoylcysteine decarboxylase/phosphopantothenate--cysteine ligase
MDGLQGRNIVVGVTGGIAAYKSPDLVRKLVAAGAQVQVVLSANATHFVGVAALQAVSGNRVRQDLWDPDAEAAMGHIELARWADMILVAPATAHCMANLAAGLAPDLLSTLCLATRAPIVLAPAMNQGMWGNPTTQANRQRLQQRGVRLLGPAFGEQACGDVGAGRMLEPAQVVAELTQTQPASVQDLVGLHVLITAGPTREPIDPVRYITNRSSGKMGYALASAATERGARVTLVSGPVACDCPAGAQCIDVETAEEMFRAVMGEVGDADIFIGCAAVADYRPLEAATQKMKRKDESMSLELVKSLDTLASVAKLSPRPYTVGFAAETQALESNASSKLKAKGLDLIAANLVGPQLGFDAEDNALLVLWPGGSQRLERVAKSTLAMQLLELIVKRFKRAPRQVDMTGSD